MKPSPALLASTLLWLIPSSLIAQEAKPPQGEVTKYTFADSKIFPGTTRDYWVYVPKQYDPARPACVYVNQDGIQYKAPEVFDELIEKKEIPVLIGVFVQPGRVKAISENALDRFNRSFEYDGLGDAYARFVLEELLPDVETKSTSDGRAIKLSKEGNDRAIAGASSGAIAAFTAAWERPDAFSRVFSTIGTYVGLRGGNEYPTLIRKVEPKPIRVFLQDGSKDLNIYGGDWWMANQEMERALTFAGYEVDHAWGDEGHNAGPQSHATKVFPSAIKWLWKDYPAPVKAGSGSQQLREIVIPGEGWQLVGEGYKFTEGPAVNAKGEVFFNDIPESKTWKVGLDGVVTPFLSDSKRANGQMFGPDGRLFVVATGPQQVIAYDAQLNPKVIAEGIRGNDLTVRHDGSLYVTFPGGVGPDSSQVIYISPGGEKKVVDTGLRYSNGVAVSPDQSLLYVADARSHWVYSYQIQPDGSLADKQKFYRLHVPDTAEDSGADGIRTDRDGRLYVATRMGVQVCDQAGRVNVILPTPNGKASNLCFGGKDFDILYVTAGDKVFRRKMKVRGANAFEAPIKPAAPRL
ncbi:SMP-30/gluconolactonase/LRE family protein [Tundrisphaera lichenicola]|uniref:SMP-30/gluconolactonase/LRE family protein n=1 Tax=Tundrisphaera lichenicola TaxID=2029860 RepID=UPI003EC0182F